MEKENLLEALKDHLDTFDINILKIEDFKSNDKFSVYYIEKYLYSLANTSKYDLSIDIRISE